MIIFYLSWTYTAGYRFHSEEENRIFFAVHHTHNPDGLWFCAREFGRHALANTQPVLRYGFLKSPGKLIFTAHNTNSMNFRAVRGPFSQQKSRRRT
jgi:hypothetical protein